MNKFARMIVRWTLKRYLREADEAERVYMGVEYVWDVRDGSAVRGGYCEDCGTRLNADGTTQTMVVAAASEAVREAVAAVRSFVDRYEKYHGFLGDVTPGSFDVVCNAALSQAHGLAAAEWLAETMETMIAKHDEESGGECGDCPIRPPGFCEGTDGCGSKLLQAAIAITAA